MFIDSGMLNEDQIFVRGCPRMDKHINKIKNKQNNINKSQNKYHISLVQKATRQKILKELIFLNIILKLFWPYQNIVKK